MKRSIATLLAAACLSALILASAVHANPLWPGVFELVDRPYSLTVPPDGSQWRALTMREGPDGFEFTVVQALYQDASGAGAGVVSLGDLIYGPEAFWRERIGVVGTCRLYRLLETGWIVRAPTDYSGSPIGEIWVTMTPPELWGSTHEVQGFVPGDSTPLRLPEAGDQILLDGVWATIEWARLGMDGDFATPVEATTWGRIKTLLGGNR